MTVHINQYFALMDQNHGGEKEWRNYLRNNVMGTDIHGQLNYNLQFEIGRR